MDKVIEALNKIENVSTTIINSDIKITNSNSFTAVVRANDITNFTQITSPNNEVCLKLELKDSDILIITPHDFVFNTIKGKIIQVNNLPELISINEMLNLYNSYIKNPEPNNNIDNTVALYLLNKMILLSAKAKNFAIDKMLLNIKKIANSTSAKDDIEEFESYLI